MRNMTQPPTFTLNISKKECKAEGLKDLFGDKIAYIRAAESEVSGSDLHALTTSKEVYMFLKVRPFGGIKMEII